MMNKLSPPSRIGVTTCKHEHVELFKATSYPDGAGWQCQICGMRFTTKQFEDWYLTQPADCEVRLSFGPASGKLTRAGYKED